MSPGARSVREKKQEVKGGRGKRPGAAERVEGGAVKESERGRKSMELKASNNRDALLAAARGGFFFNHDHIIFILLM